MQQYSKSGNCYFPYNNAHVADLKDCLPGGNYILKQDMFKGIFLEKIDSFPALGKIYGNTDQNADRILNTFMDREFTTGVLLAGEKGAGKSFLAKHVVNKAQDQGIPTIIINAPWCGDEFNKFVQNIDQPAILLFDEFEKVYDANQQAAILTLLDGMFPSKKLFLLTCNEKGKLNANMMNRPGRIYYMMEFSGLDEDFIREYATDNLKNKSIVEKIVKLSSLFYAFNFDMLKAIIEECNRYDETPEAFIHILNTKPETARRQSFTAELNVDGKKVSLDWDRVEANPHFEDISLSYSFLSQEEVKQKDENNEDYDLEEISFQPNDIHAIKNRSKVIVYRRDNYELKLVKIEPKVFDYTKVL